MRHTSTKLYSTASFLLTALDDQIIQQRPTQTQERKLNLYGLCYRYYHDIGVGVLFHFLSFPKNEFKPNTFLYHFVPKFSHL